MAETIDARIKSGQEDSRIYSKDSRLAAKG